ncbi:MAG: phtD [Deltaproteobacteria bacterium]|nr:phtD [Deltaproteobacteria bacterium]
MAKTKITLALGSYDRHAPLLEGCIQHPEFEVEYIELDPQQGRHERFLQHFEFDAAELSFSSYLIAVDQNLPVHAVPIFPRRLFSQSQMYKNVNCGIDAPKDLVGKRIGLSGYQNTLGVRAKGDLTHFYGVERTTVTWITPGKEVVDVELPADLRIETRGSMAEIEREFVDGKIHAMFVSRLPKPFRDGNKNLARLFADPQAEEERYLREEGYFPIMHVLAFKKELAQQHPELPRALYEIFEQARQRATERWVDPNWSMAMWGRRELERQNGLCSFDPWKNGLEANRKNIERFALYSHEQGLTKRRLTPEELFVALD